MARDKDTGGGGSPGATAHLIRVVHAHAHATSGKVVHLPFLRAAAILRGEDHLECAGPVNHKVCGLVLQRREDGSGPGLQLGWGVPGPWSPTPTGTDLVAVGMPANGDGLGPARDETRDVLTDDGLPEDSSSEDVPDGSIGALPHLLQLELYEDKDEVAPLQPPPSDQDLNPKQECS